MQIEASVNCLRRCIAVVGCFVLVMTIVSAGMAEEPSRTPNAVASTGLDEFLTERKYHAIPIDCRSPLRLNVRGQIGNRPTLFLLDTAANYLISVSRKLVDDLKLPTRVEDKELVAGPYNEGMGQLYARVEELKFGDAVLSKCEVSVYDDLGRSHVTDTKGLTSQGIIGNDLLTGTHALIDVPNAKLYLRTASGPTDAVGTELAAYFKAQGYVEMLCSRRKGAIPFLKCKIGDHDLTLIVDTGAQNTMLDRAVAERIGIKSRPISPGSDTGRGSLTAALSLSRNLVLEPPNEILIYDFSTLNRGLEKQGLPRMDGLLGVNLFKYFSAVIDYSRPEPRLFLIDPNVRDARLMDGEWAGEAAEVGGERVPADDAKNYRLTILKDQFDLQLGAGRRLRLEFVQLCPDPDLKWFDLSAAGRRVKQSYPCIYEVSRDRLRVCMPLDVKPGEKIERPKEFKSKPGSPYAAFTFRRVAAK